MDAHRGATQAPTVMSDHRPVLGARAILRDAEIHLPELEACERSFRPLDELDNRFAGLGPRGAPCEPCMLWLAAAATAARKQNDRRYDQARATNRPQRDTSQPNR